MKNVCCALVCNHTNSILLVKNKNREWEIPGGKVENTDKINFKETCASFVDCDKVGHREFYEETGIFLQECLNLENNIYPNCKLVGCFFYEQQGTLFYKYECVHTPLKSTDDLDENKFIYDEYEETYYYNFDHDECWLNHFSNYYFHEHNKRHPLETIVEVKWFQKDKLPKLSFETDYELIEKLL